MLLLFALACGPTQDAVPAYTAAMAPVLTRNQQLGQRFVDLATQVKKGDVDGATVAARLGDELLPAADQLLAQADAVKVNEPELAKVHAELIVAWRDRSAAWKALGDAYKKGDTTGFDAAYRQTMEANVEEEGYFRDVAAFAAARGGTFDPYP